MAAVTREQITRARDEGYQAGYSRGESRPNPYAPEHVPAWDRRRRTQAGRDALDEAQRPAMILARTWRVAYQRGMAAYRAERGTSAPGA